MPQGSAIGTVGGAAVGDVIGHEVGKCDGQPAMRRLQVSASRSFIDGLRAPSHPFLFGDVNMLQTIAIILIILWVLGLVSSYTMGGFIHILLVVAVVIILLRLIQGRGL